MKKREIKEVEERLLSQTEVPDRVLDSARAELEDMRRENIWQKERQTGRRVGAPVGAAGAHGGAAAQTVSRRRIAVIAAACLVVVAAVVIVVAVAIPKSNFSNQPLYSLSELEAREISSVAQYNEEKGTQYLCANEGVTQSYAYSDGSRDVLLSESFSFGDSGCTLYVLTDSSDKSVDILQPFYDCAATAEVSGTEVCYDGDSCNSAYFYSGGSAYFLSVDEGGYELLFDVLQYIIVA